MTETERVEQNQDSRFREFTQSELEDYYEKKFHERMNEMEARMEEKFLNCFSTHLGRKGKGKGKGKKPQVPQPSVSEAANQRMASYLNDIRATPSTSSRSLFTDDEDLPLRPRRNQTTTRTTTTTKTVYIKKIDCQINNTSIDQGTYCEMTSKLV